MKKFAKITKGKEMTELLCDNLVALKNEELDVKRSCEMTNAAGKVINYYKSELEYRKQIKSTTKIPWFE